ncbi:MAG TPA: HEAT repeat domain-containing protein [Gemmatimonadaceae bacterium]
MHRGLGLLSALLVPSLSLGAQSLADRVIAVDGPVQVVFPSRPAVCGDGQSIIANVLGQSNYYSIDQQFSGHGRWSDRPCVHGPARVVATVVGREVIRLRTYVGPEPSGAADARSITATATDAAAWLGEIASRSAGRVASDALLPLIIADAPEPWPRLLGIARDENRPRDVRRAALTWLANGVNDRLGIADARDDSDDDQMRSQAIFVLSQRPKSESIPELIEVARSTKHPAARRSAIFWLGQTGDPRATDLFAELLRQ